MEQEGQNMPPDWAQHRALELTRTESTHLTETTRQRLAFARYIAEHEEPPVDPLLIEARNVIAEHYGSTRMADGSLAVGDGPRRNPQSHQRLAMTLSLQDQGPKPRANAYGTALSSLRDRAPAGLDHSASIAFAGRPRLLDLFCCAGGAAMGYHMAGFTVVGIDQDWQPNYPFFMRREKLFDDQEHAFALWIRENFDAVHASPPCQKHSDLAKQSKVEYPCFIDATRRVLKLAGLPYVIENVEGAPLINPVRLCGTMFPELRVIRHRLFETNWPLWAPEKCEKHPLVFTHDKRKAHYGKLDEMKAFVQVTGGGNCSKAAAADAMRIDWMTKNELNEALPPAYTRFIGRQLLTHITVRGLARMTRDRDGSPTGRRLLAGSVHDGPGRNGIAHPPSQDPY